MSIGGYKVVVKIMVLGSWLWSITLALPPILGWGSFAPEVNGMSCAPSWTRVSEYIKTIKWVIAKLKADKDLPKVL